MRNNRFIFHNWSFFQTRWLSLWLGTTFFFFVSLTNFAGIYQFPEYLTESEVMRLRKAQKPYKRMAVLNRIFKSRMKSAVKSQKKDLGLKNKNEVFNRTATVDWEGRNKNNSQRKSFVLWMQEVVLCLEEIETNLDGFPVNQALNSWDVDTGLPIYMDYKRYGNSLKKLLNSLNEMNSWLNEIHNELPVSEKKVCSETSEFLTDLTRHIHGIIEVALRKSKLKKNRN